MNNNIENDSLRRDEDNIGNTYYNQNDFITNNRKKQDNKMGQEEFIILGPISLIYAVIFTFCLYKNFSGITSPIWTAATVYYMVYVAKKMNKKWKYLNYFVSTAIILLGISNFLTDNTSIIFLNYFAVILLIIINMMFLFLDIISCNVINHLQVICQAILGCICNLTSSISHLKRFCKNNKINKNKRTTSIILGIVLTIPILFTIWSMLASADRVFGELSRKVFEKIFYVFKFEDIIGNIIIIIFMLIIGYAVPYAFSRYISTAQNIENNENKNNVSPLIPTIIMTSISVLYVAFSIVQIMYLFIREGNLPSDYTYAEYAREGFFQLLLISVFNVVVVLICVEFLRKNKILDIILTVVCLCTFVMIASSGCRMKMYINEYGLTRTRIVVLWALAVITLIMAGLVYRLFKKTFNLFRYSLIVTTICFLVLSFSHMDYFIAKYDLDMYQKAEKQQETINGLTDEEYWQQDDCFAEYADYDYVMSLSADAEPELSKHKEKIYDYYRKLGYEEKQLNWNYIMSDLNERAYNKCTFRDFNISRYVAGLIAENNK